MGQLKVMEKQTGSAEKSKQQPTTRPLTVLREEKPVPRPQGRPAIHGENRLSVQTIRQVCGSHEPIIRWGNLV